MPPKKKPQKRKERFRCDEIDGERFHAPTQEVFRFNWWEVFCFPYILCARVWDCCVNMCAGTNQCLVYWMLIQWIVCKITKVTTPNPILFPYYFYLFCQVILLTAFFCLLWSWMGRSLLIPYFLTYYKMFAEDEDIVGTVAPPNTTRLSFRRYCFKKSEIFETSFSKEEENRASRESRVLGSTGLLMVESMVYNLLNQIK